MIQGQRSALELLNTPRVPAIAKREKMAQSIVNATTEQNITHKHTTNSGDSTTLKSHLP